MKRDDLIAKLQTLPQDIEVFVGYHCHNYNQTILAKEPVFISQFVYTTSTGDKVFTNDEVEAEKYHVGRDRDPYFYMGVML